MLPALQAAGGGTTTDTAQVAEDGESATRNSMVGLGASRQSTIDIDRSVEEATRAIQRSSSATSVGSSSSATSVGGSSSAVADIHGPHKRRSLAKIGHVPNFHRYRKASSQLKEAANAADTAMLLDKWYASCDTSNYPEAKLIAEWHRRQPDLPDPMLVLEAFMRDKVVLTWA